MNIAEARAKVLAREGDVFPAKVYTQTELAPAYRFARAEYLGHIRAINIAHLAMLVEKGLLPRDMGRRIMRTVLEIDYESYAPREYTGEHEDIYFVVESEIIRRCGDEGGFIHLARSRNDMGVTQQRMTFREKILRTAADMLDFLEILRAFAEEHKSTLFVAHTHTQQAQPSVIGHYVLAAFDLLLRDFDRLRRAYANTNRSPMGGAAITATSFDIDRERVAKLLGFDSVIENAYDAIGGCDFFADAAQAVQLTAIDTGKLVYDMILWATQEFGVIRLARPYMQISSMMPQKLNPVALEHSRPLLSAVMGQAATVLSVFHNTPYGDTADCGDDINPHLAGALDGLASVHRLLGAVFATMEVDKKRLRQMADDSFSVISELADMLVRYAGISFRQAHGVATLIARECVAKNLKPADVDDAMVARAYKEKVGGELKLPAGAVRLAFSPRNFVDTRNVQGGTGDKPMREMLAIAERNLEERRGWLAGSWKQLERAATERERVAKEMAG